MNSVDIDIDSLPTELVKTCPECGGRGEVRSSHWYTCYDCKGRGKVTVPGVDRLIERLTIQSAKE